MAPASGSNVALIVLVVAALLSGLGTALILALLVARLSSSTADSAREHAKVDSVETTKIRIRELVKEIHEYSESDVVRHEFFKQFLARIVASLVGSGGAVWTTDAQGRFHLECAQTLEQNWLLSGVVPMSDHAVLLRYSLNMDEGVYVAPRGTPAGAVGKENGMNISDQYLVLVPRIVDTTTFLVVEVLLDRQSPEASVRGYKRFLIQMSKMAAQYMRRQSERDRCPWLQFPWDR